MDAEEYFKTVPPRREIGKRGKVSVLDPHWPAIQKARAGGYTLAQIVDFLKTNSVMITPAGLSVYIKRREARQSKKNQESI